MASCHVSLPDHALPPPPLPPFHPQMTNFHSGEDRGRTNLLLPLLFDLASRKARKAERRTEKKGLSAGGGEKQRRRRLCHTSSHSLFPHPFFLSSLVCRESGRTEEGRGGEGKILNEMKRVVWGRRKRNQRTSGAEGNEKRSGGHSLSRGETILGRRGKWKKRVLLFLLFFIPIVCVQHRGVLFSLMRFVLFLLKVRGSRNTTKLINLLPADENG